MAFICAVSLGVFTVRTLGVFTVHMLGVFTVHMLGVFTVDMLGMFTVHVLGMDSEHPKHMAGDHLLSLLLYVHTPDRGEMVLCKMLCMKFLTVPFYMDV